jgi:hypothetical protein
MPEFTEPPVHIIRKTDKTLFVDPNTALPFYHYHAQVAHVIAEFLGPDWSACRVLDDDEKPPVPWSQDISAELAYNKGPYEVDGLNDNNGWWKREPDEMDGATIHHTFSDSPHATARYCANTKGVPSIQYHIWISQTGEVLLCAPLTWGIYHDSTGFQNTHLSIGLAGRLHEYRPADVQLQAAADVSAWAISALPKVKSIAQVKGHRGWVQVYHDQGYYKDRDLPTPWTICPGWDAEASGHWKKAFYDLLWEKAGKG